MPKYQARHEHFSAANVETFLHLRTNSILTTGANHFLCPDRRLLPRRLPLQHHPHVANLSALTLALLQHRLPNAPLRPIRRLLQPSPTASLLDGANLQLFIGHHSPRRLHPPNPGFLPRQRLRNRQTPQAPAPQRNARNHPRERALADRVGRERHPR